MKLEILYTETLNNAISCNMDNITILNLKEMHQRQMNNNFCWFGYENWLNKLNTIYKKVPRKGY